MPSPETSIATYTTALNIWMDYGEHLPFGTYDVSQLRLVSGLPFNVYELGYVSPQEGRTVAAVVGAHEDLTINPDGPLVRLHSACMFSELGDNRTVQAWLQHGTEQPSDFLTLETHPSPECDCRAQRLKAQAAIAQEGGIYIDLTEQDGRGAGLAVKREAYRLHAEQGLDTVQAYEKIGVQFDAREYGHCARFILEDLGLNKIRLMSNNPRKIGALTSRGITVKPVSLIVGVTEHNIGYLKTKRDKAGHRFPEVLRFTDQGN